MAIGSPIWRSTSSQTVSRHVPCFVGVVCLAGRSSGDFGPVELDAKTNRMIAAELGGGGLLDLGPYPMVRIA